MTPFGLNIRELRIKHNWSRTKLAGMIDVTAQAVANWENGVVKFPRSQKVIDSICEVFKVSEAELFGYSLNPTIKSLTPESSSKAVMVSSGSNQTLVEYDKDRHFLPQSLHKRWPEGYFVVMTDESMNLLIPQGAFVFINASTFDIRSDDIVAARIEDDSIIIRRIQYFDTLICLNPVSSHADFKSEYYDSSGKDNRMVSLLGRAIWFDKTIDHNEQ